MSFAPGTRVLLANGEYARIETIRAGVKVITCRGRAQPVARAVNGRARKFMTITADDGKPFHSSIDHPILAHRGWMKAMSIKAADQLVRFISHGSGAASVLWGTEEDWRGRITRIDQRALALSPWPQAMLHTISAPVRVTSSVCSSGDEYQQAFDLSVPDEGYVVEGVIVHDASFPKG